MAEAAEKKRWGIGPPEKKEEPKSKVEKPEAWGMRPSTVQPSRGLRPFLSVAPKKEEPKPEPVKEPEKLSMAPKEPEPKPVDKPEAPKEIKVLEPVKDNHRGVGALLKPKEKEPEAETKVGAEVKVEQKEQPSREWAIGQRHTQPGRRVKHVLLSDELKGLISTLSSAGESNVSGAVDTLRKILGIVGAFKGGGGQDQATASAIREAAKSLQSVAEAIARPWKITFDKDGTPSGIEKK